ARGLGSHPDGAPAGQKQPAHQRIRGRQDALHQGEREESARDPRELSDRAGPRVARRRDRTPAPPAGPRPRGRVARPATPDDPAGKGWREGAPGLFRSRSRVRPRRPRGEGARAARLPDDPAHGRDPVRELHGLPGRREAGEVRRLDPRRGLGDRPFPARGTGPQDRAVRVDGRLLRLRADAVRRRARGVSRRGLQRGDDRARRRAPGPARPLDLHRRAGRHRPARLRTGPAVDARVDRVAFQVPRVRHAVRPGDASRQADAAARARLPPRHDAHRRERGRLGGRHPPAPSHRAGVRGPPPRHARRRAAHGLRTPDRPDRVRRPGRRDRRRLCPRPLPHARLLRPRRGAGRPVDHDGARRQPPAVHLPATAEPLRAELPRRASPAAIRRSAANRLRRRDARGAGTTDARAPPRESRVRTGRARRRRARGGLHRSAVRVRALEPRQHGYVTRDGVRLHWELFGNGKTAVFLLPAWSIVNSLHWKFQVPFLARHCRVLTMDGRGSGLSDRPVDPQAYGDAAFVADAFAVMDAAGIERAAVAGLSSGGLWAVMMAAQQPRRVTSLALIAPAAWVVPPDPELLEAVGTFEDVLPTHPGWHRWNAAYWMSNYPDFVQFFMERCFPERHSAKQIEDTVGWGLETTPEVLVAIER